MKIHRNLFILALSFFLVLDGVAFNTPNMPSNVIQADIVWATVTANKKAACVSDAEPIVTFTATSGGTSPYTFYYTQNGVSNNVISSAGNNSATINIPTTSAQTFTVTLDSVSYGGFPASVISGESVIVAISNPPSLDFTFNNNECSGADINFVTILSNPQNFLYSWNFGDGTTSEEQNPTHNFYSAGTSGTQDFNVTLTVTDTTNNCTATKTATVTINKGADITITSNASYGIYNGSRTFSICENSTKDLEFYNASSTIGTNTSYKIDWGDGSPVYTGTSWSTLNHTYSVGLWNMKYTVYTSSGCDVTITYKIFVGSNPSVSLGNPGNTDVCANTPLVFPITGTESNPPGTTYTVIFNDGTAPIVLNSYPPPKEVSHTFTKTSCGVTSSNGIKTFPNSFSATITAQNPCGESSVNVVPIYVTTGPDASIKASRKITCVDEIINLSFPDSLQTIAGPTGCVGSKTVWTITPNANYSLNGSFLGNDFGSNDYNVWQSGSYAITPSFSVPGQYIVKVRVGNKCSIDESVDTICVTAPPVPNFTIDNNSGCFPLTVNTTNLTDESENCGSPMGYRWEITSYVKGSCGTTRSYTMTEGANVITNGSSTSKNTTIVFNNPGTYTLRLAAISTCGTFYSTPLQTITVNAPPKVTINATPDVCQTFPETSITPTSQVTNCGTGTLTYQWSFPGGTPATSTDADPGSISYPTPGKYHIDLKVTNECGITTAAADTFLVKPTPILTSTIPNQLKCAGQMSDAVHFTADIANTVFHWTNNNTQIGLAASGTGDISSFTLTNSGSTTLTATITVIPSLNGCDGASQSFTITVEPSVYFTSQPKSSEVCLNGVPQTLTVTYANGSGTPVYQWYSNTVNDNTTGTAISGANSSTYDPPANTIGTTYYYCIATFSASVCGTIVSDVAEVTVEDFPSIDLQPLATQQICVGGVIDSLRVSTINGAGNPQYQWYSNTTNSNSGGTAISGAIAATYEPTAFNSVGTYYFYVVVNYPASNCGTVISDPAEVIVVADPVIDSQPIATQSICQNTSPASLSVTVSGGIGTYNYQWYSNVVNSNTGGTPVASANSDTYIPPTDVTGTVYYYCLVTQTGVGCDVTSATSEVIVVPAPTITAQPQSATICLGDVLSALSVSYQNGVGAPQYQWYENTVDNNTSGTAISGEINSTYTPPYTVVGTMYYYCIITIPSGGCNTLVSNTAEITVNQYPVISNYTTQIPSGATFNVTPSTLIVPTDIIPAGTTYTWEAPVIQPAGAISGGSAETNPQTSISQTLTNNTNATATATYIVTPMSNGCAGDTFTVVVTVFPPITVNSTVNNVTCFGANNGEIHIQISGGYLPYNITWTGPNGFTSSSADITGLEPGQYQLDILDGQGVPYSETFEISEPAELTIVTISTQNINCNGADNGEISTTATGGTTPYSYSWTKDGNPFSTDSIISNLQAGVYELTLNDANNCGPVIQSYTITEPTPIIITLIDKIDILCFGDSTGAITVDVQGGVLKEKLPGVFDYDYLWTGPNGFTSVQKDISQLKAGNYTLAVTDSLNCTRTFAVTVNQSNEIIIDITKKSVTCFGADDGAIKIDISGGVAPYDILWNDFSKETFRENLSPGTYIVTVTDNNSCKVTKEIEVESNSFQLHPIIKQITCNGANNGSIALNVTNNIHPVTLVWDDNPLAGATRNGLKPGNYTVTVSDTYCTYTNTYAIYEPLSINAAATISNAFNCSNPNSGSISLVVSGGTEPYTYHWSNGETTKDIFGIPAGTYIVDITDSNGCNFSKQFEITRQSPVEIQVGVTPDYNCDSGILQMKCTAEVTGGVAPYQYTWSSGTVSGANNEIMETTVSGIYTLTVTDNLGCVAGYTFELTVPKVGVAYTMIDCNSRTYRFDALIPYGQPNDYNFMWNFGDGKTSTSQNIEHKYASPGTYKVTLSTLNKTNGCKTVFEKNVDIIAPPSLALNEIPVICPGDSILLHATGASTYKWWNGSTADSILITSTGDYMVEGTNQYGCSSVLNFTVKNFDTFDYMIQSDKNIVSTDNSTVRFWTDDIPNSEYYWDFGDGTTSVGNPQYHTYTIVHDGYYDVNLKINNPNGCDEFAAKRIWITNGPLKNTFSPNGDGIDDIYMKGWHIKIYNRNGVLLYDGTEGWDGTYKGNNVANDTYFVVVYYPTPDGIRTDSGYITIIR